MIDTLKLRLIDYSIKQHANLSVEPPNYLVSTGETVNEHLLYKDQHLDIRGKKAYLNEILYNLDLRPFKNAVYCDLHFSAPKVVYGENLNSIDKRQFEDCLKLIEKSLANNGIMTNLKNTTLSRVDLNKTFTTNEDFVNYFQLFQHLNCKRATLREFGKNVLTFLYSNTQYQVCIYSKYNEMMSRGVSVEGVSQNSMRSELRLMNKVKIKSSLGYNSTSELIYNYDNLESFYNSTFENNLFRYSAPEYESISINEFEGTLIYYRDKYGVRGFDKLRKRYGDQYISTLMTLEGIATAIMNVYKQRKKVSTYMRDLNESKFDINILRNNEAANQKSNSVDLYNEIKEKITSVNTLKLVG